MIDKCQYVLSTDDEEEMDTVSALKAPSPSIQVSIISSLVMVHIVKTNLSYTAIYSLGNKFTINILVYYVAYEI